MFSPERSGDGGERRITRRRLLSTTAAAGATLVGISGSTTVGARSKKDGTEPAPEGYPTVSTRGHFTDDAELVEDESETSYQETGDWEGFESDDDTELVVVVHGWTVSEGGGADVAYTCDLGLQENGYDEFVVGYSWDADRGDSVDFGWDDAKEIATQNGPKLASFVADRADEGQSIRLVGHSLGARVVGAGLRALHENDRTDSVASAVFLGGAVDDETAATGERYGPAIDAVPDRFDNFHKDDDEVLDTVYEWREWDEAIGEDGIEGEAPATYTDHDVTDAVASHNAYYQPEDGCLPQVVATFED